MRWHSFIFHPAPFEKWYSHIFRCITILFVHQIVAVLVFAVLLQQHRPIPTKWNKWLTQKMKFIPISIYTLFFAVQLRMMWCTKTVFLLLLLLVMMLLLLSLLSESGFIICSAAKPCGNIVRSWKCVYFRTGLFKFVVSKLAADNTVSVEHSE